MANHSGNSTKLCFWSRIILAIRYQLLLVPEAVLLLALLCLHVVLGAPLVTALLGLGLVGWFGCRSLLIMAARRAINAAKYDRATHLIRWAIRLYPFSADAQALRGTLYMAQGNMAEAERALRHALAFYPESAALHVLLSGALLEEGRPGEARQQALRALQLDPACASAYLHLTHAEQQLGTAPAAVEALLREGLQRNPAPADEAALRCTLAVLLVTQERQAEAQLILAGIELLLAQCPAPQRAGLHYYLGDVRRAIGDVESARGHFSESEQLDPHGRYAADAWRAARS